MKKVSFKEFLASIEKQEHPEWLSVWEQDDVDYLVAYRDLRGKFTIQPVGPNLRLKTLAKAIAERKSGFPHAYTPSLTFSIRSFEYERQELEDRIAVMQEREACLNRQWEAQPSTEADASENAGNLSLREREVARREVELNGLEQRLKEEKADLQLQSQFIDESEEQLNQKLEAFLQREALIEQREEDVSRKAFKLGIAL